MRVVVFTLTAAIQLAAGAAVFLILLLGLNGFSERQATPGLVLYIVLGLGGAVGMSLAAVLAAKRLVERRSLGRAAASAIAVVGANMLGALILAAAFVAALVLAEVMRGMR
jgi:hypothetical protein